MHTLLAKIFRLLRGKLQWYLLWIFHDKFIIGVSGVVQDGEGKILLLRHRYWRAGTWGLPSGYAEKGERLTDSLAREVLEETGYIVSVDSLMKLTSGFQLRLELSFLAHLTGGIRKLDPKEILDADFFSLDNLPDGLLDSHRQILLSIREGAAEVILDGRDPRYPAGT
jgi:8-oxo-dGTP diphosphatase